MALARYEGVAQDSAGNVISNATVEVRRDQAGRPVVPLFSDRDGLVPMGNPITANDLGQFGFHAPGGVYYIRVFTGPSQAPFQEYTRRYQALGTAGERDVEELASSLNSGLGIFSTFENLELFTPDAGNVGARVLNDTDPSLNGDYIYVTDTWVKQRSLPDSLGRMTVTGGTADAVEAEVAAGVDPGIVVMLFIEPDETNTDEVTINGLPLLSVKGDELLPGQFLAGRSYFLTDEGDHYRLRQESDLTGLADGITAVAAAALADIDDATGTAIAAVAAQTVAAEDAADDAAASAAAILEVEDAAFATRKTYVTWAELVLVTGTAGQAAEVSAGDGGSHTGYVYGTDVSTPGVANAGIYVWSVALSAWRRVFDSSMSGRVIEHGAFFTTTTGDDVLEGEYFLTPSAPADGFVSSFFAQITSGEGPVTVYVLVNGHLVHGPVVLEGDTPSTSDSVGTAVHRGDEITVMLVDVDDCTGLWVQISGGN